MTETVCQKGVTCLPRQCFLLRTWVERLNSAQRWCLAQHWVFQSGSGFCTASFISF